MASGFFALFDDIALLMDDITTMSQVATKKTVGILGDDLAVNAQKASGFASSRELPVIWAITKGSFINKVIILPIAFLLSAFAPWLIVPILMIGGVYLAFEGAEKIYEYFVPHEQERKAIETLEEKSQEQILADEKVKIKSAIITDFILSVEIVIIALGAVATQTLTVQIAVVSFVALLATVGVYGLVALLVRMDDFGYQLIATNGGDSRVGEFFVMALPKVIQSLALIGTLAMLLVAGGIYLHNWDALHETLHFMPSLLSELLVGLITGAIAVVGVKLVKMVKN
ncbi:MAG: membrane protein [Sulfurovum sp. PC08-66]|jgi:predicted DNA repair protein MutK|nr:MAG: membrane protein [Sulfurovum sp. PC08-66]